MNNATMSSKRLQSVRQVLSDGQPHSTRDIVRRARVMAVSACVAELRANGAEITCLRRKTDWGWVYDYTMLKGPEA